MSNMGERIRNLRKAKGLTQEELGKYIGVKKSAIMKYEKGEVQNMKRSSIEVLSKLFNVSPSYLMCLEDNNQSDNEHSLVIDTSGFSDEDIEYLKKQIEYLKFKNQKSDKT